MSIKTTLIRAALAATVSTLCVPFASAHVNYTGKDFGTLSNLVPQSLTISNILVETNSGWADGTDDDFANAHHVSWFRFNLADITTLTITATGTTNGTDQLPGLLPGFSIYSGLAHLTGGPDYDTNPTTIAYLQTLGGTQPKEGAFRALNTWQMGNLAGSMSTFTFMDYAVDGTSANFGNVPGIVGDGLANGTVTRTFTLGPGDYSIVVAGADVVNETANDYGVSVNVTTVPEPASVAILSLGMAAVCASRRRRNSQYGA